MLAHLSGCLVSSGNVPDTGNNRTQPIDRQQDFGLALTTASPNGSRKRVCGREVFSGCAWRKKTASNAKETEGSLAAKERLARRGSAGSAHVIQCRHTSARAQGPAKVSPNAHAKPKEKQRKTTDKPRESPTDRKLHTHWPVQRDHPVPLAEAPPRRATRERPKKRGRGPPRPSRPQGPGHTRRSPGSIVLRSYTLQALGHAAPDNAKRAKG